MRRLRFRLTVRRLALLIALIAVGLLGWRVYREGADLHWLVLKLLYGNVQTRRAAAHELYRQIAMRMFQRMFGMDPVPADPREREEYMARGRERGAW